MQLLALNPLLRTLSSAPAATHVALSFDLAGEAVLSFVAPRAGRLRVTNGRVWATRSGRPDAPPDDVVLGTDLPLPVARGERWVLESWHAGKSASLCFE
ncbi:MAG: DUF2917 domain-containing protein [Variovorax sp.]